MMTDLSTQQGSHRLGARTGELTPGASSSLSTATVGLGLLAPLAVALQTSHGSGAPLVIAIALAVVGLGALAVALVELLPAPAVTFHEHGFVVRDVDGSLEVHEDGHEHLTTIPPAMGTNRTSSLATR